MGIMQGPIWGLTLSFYPLLIGCKVSQNTKIKVNLGHCY